MLTLHFDYPSPAAAVAVLRLQRIADGGGNVAFSGLDVLGLDLTLPPTLDQLDELERWRERAAELGLPMRRPSRRPPTLDAHLIGALAEVEGLGASWRLACLRAYYVEDADLSDHEMLVRLAREVGFDTEAVGGRLGDTALRNAARQRAITLRGRGIGGVPVLEVDGTFVPADLGDDDLRALAGM